MCQTNSHGVKSKVVRGYRRYRLFGKEWVTPIVESPLPKIGKLIDAWRDPFHAFALKKCALAAMSPGERLYLVELRRNIKRGLWMGDVRFPTYTADRMKIIRRIK